MAAVRVDRLTPFPSPGQLLHTSRSAKSSETEAPPFARSHITSFFAQYPNFKYDPSQPFMDEFWRLVDTQGFGLRGKRYKSARKQVGVAILKQFKDLYGARTCNIHVWHQFFSAIGIDEAPRDIGLCHRNNVANQVHSFEYLRPDRPTDRARPKIAPPISKKEDPILGRLFRHINNPPKPKGESPAIVPSAPAKVTKESEDAGPSAGP